MVVVLDCWKGTFLNVAHDMLASSAEHMHKILLQRTTAVYRRPARAHRRLVIEVQEDMSIICLPEDQKSFTSRRLENEHDERIRG
jgi:hypothetical protein